MAKQIKFDGKIHSFPDDATEDEINQTLGGAPEQASVGRDIENITSNFPEYGMKFAKAIPSEAEGALHMPLGRSLKNVAAGYLGVANVPHMLAEYAQSRHIPYAEKLINHYPWKADLDPNKYLGLGEQQPGDIAFQLAGPGGWAKKGIEALGHAGSSGASKIPSLLSKAGDILPLTKGIESTPYTNLKKYLVENKIGENVKVDPKLLKEAKVIMKSKGIDIPAEAIKHTFSLAEKGNHQGIFAVQSGLKTIGRKLSKLGGPEGELGNKVHTLAEKIMEGTKQHYRNIGHPVAADLMTQGTKRSAARHKIMPYRNIATGAALTAAAAPKWIKDLIHTVT